MSESDWWGLVLKVAGVAFVLGCIALAPDDEPETPRSPDYRWEQGYYDDQPYYCGPAKIGEC